MFLFLICCVTSSRNIVSLTSLRENNGILFFKRRHKYLKIENKFLCNVEVRLDNLKLYKKDDITDILISIDKEMIGFNDIAEFFESNNEPFFINFKNTTYYITERELVGDKLYNRISFETSSFSDILNVTSILSIYDNGIFSSSARHICSQRTNTFYVLMQKSLNVIYIMFPYFLLFNAFIFFYGLFYTTVLSNIFIYDKDMTMIVGNTKYLEKNYILFKHVVNACITTGDIHTRVYQIRRDKEFICYDRVLCFPINDNLCFLLHCCDTLSKNESLDFKVVVDNFSFKLSPVHVSSAEPKPFYMTFTNSNGDSVQLEFAHSFFVPYQLGGTLYIIILSVFNSFIDILNSSSHSPKNFHVIANNVSQLLRLRSMIILDENDENVFEYYKSSRHKLSDNYLANIIERSIPGDVVKVRVDNRIYLCYRNDVSGVNFSVRFFVLLKISCYTYSHKSILLPLITSCLGNTYFFFYTKEQNLKINRLTSVLENTKRFSIAEVDFATERILFCKNYINQKEPKMVSQIFSLLPGFPLDFYETHKDSIRQGFSSEVMFKNEKDVYAYYYIINTNHTKEYENIVTIFIECTSLFKYDDPLLSRNNNDIARMKDILNLRSFFIKGKDIILSTYELYTDLGLSHGSDMSLYSLIYPRDKQHLDSLFTKDRSTFRLIDSSGNLMWYTSVSDGEKGFLFPVNNLIKARNSIEAVERNLSLMTSPAHFLFWSVDFTRDKVSPMLYQPTIFDMIGVHENTFSSLYRYIHSDDIEQLKDHINNISSVHSFSKDVRLNVTGRYQWFKFVFSWVSNEETHCIAININEQKLKENDMIKVQKESQELMATGGIFIWEFMNTHDNIARNGVNSDVNSRIKINWASIHSYVHQSYVLEFSNSVKLCFSDPNAYLEMNLPVNLPSGQIFVSARGKLVPQTGTLLGTMIEITQISNKLNKLQNRASELEEETKQKTRFLEFIFTSIYPSMKPVSDAINSLGNNNLPDEQKLLLDSLKSSSQQLMKTLHDCQTCHDTISTKVNEKIFDFVSFFESHIIVSALRAKVNKLNFKIDIVYPFPKLAHGDSALLSYVYNNLLSNALKFTKSGYLHVRFEWLCDNNNTEFCCLEVTDTGIGIDPKNINLISSQLEQVDQSIQSRSGGSGMGLLFVKQIIKAVNGDISVSSTINKGSTFKIRFPMSSTYYMFSPPFTDKKKHFLLFSFAHSDSFAYLNNWFESLHYACEYFTSLDDLMVKISSIRENSVLDGIFVEGQHDLCRKILNFYKTQNTTPLLSSVCEIEEPSILPTKITKPIIPARIVSLLNSSRYRMEH